MADPKYADLPGIAHNEPDVYETSDLPESEQTNIYDEENDSIERIHISADEAFNKFKGKFLKSNKVDFSDKIVKGIKKGYDTEDWELSAYGENETTLQKYCRLQTEFNELLEEVKLLKSKDDTKLWDGKLINIQDSIDLLNQLKLEQTLGSTASSSVLADPLNHVQKLMSQLDKVETTVSNEKQSSTKDVANVSGVIFQLNYNPNRSKLIETARINLLEGRIRQLEKILGTSDDKLTRLASANLKGSLIETAEHLSATASLLDSSQLDHIEGRLSSFLQTINAISDKKKQINHDEEKDKMILEMYEILKNSENINKLLPETINRLKSLETIHAKAGEFTKTITEIEVLQSDIKENLQDNKILLKDMQDNFSKNLKEINSTILNLDARIKALKK